MMKAESMGQRANGEGETQPHNNAVAYVAMIQRFDRCTQNHYNEEEREWRKWQTHWT